MDLRDWLRSLGLERYEAAFRENEIDETVLPNLTAEDLKDVGVGIVCPGSVSCRSRKLARLTNGET
jgi:SAM domain (Sterile alpha motif)